MPLPFAELDGLRVHFEAEGYGQKTVVLIHGASLDLRMWEGDFVNGLNRTGYQVIRYDIRGHGQSDAPVDGHSFGQYARDALALLDELDVERPALVGLSLGGAIALELALLAPQRITGLVLLGTALPGYPFSSEFGAVFQGAVNAMATPGSAGLQPWLESGLFDPLRQNAAAFAPVLAQIENYSRTPLLQIATDEGPHASDRLEELALPILTLVGELDLPDFHDVSALIAQRAPDAESAVIDGAGHCVPIEKPQEVLQVALPFLRRCKWDA